MRSATQPDTVQAVIELLSYKLGVVLLVLGGMHFLNLYVFSRMRRRALLRYEPPPVAPQQYVAPPAA